MAETVATEIAADRAGSPQPDDGASSPPAATAEEGQAVRSMAPADEQAASGTGAADSLAPLVAAAPSLPEAAPAKRRSPAIWAAAAACAVALGLGWLASQTLQGAALKAQQADMQATLADLNARLGRLGADVEKLSEATSQLAAYPRPAMPSLQPLSARIDGLSAAVERSQKEIGARLATLADARGASVAERKEAAERIEKVSQRVDKLEKSLATGSISAGASGDGAQPLPAKADPQRLDAFRLREVYDGIAVIEDKRGIIYEVARGDQLPGAGRVTKLEKRGKSWVVLAEKGMIAGR